MTCFYLGAHHPHWLAHPDLPHDVALFVSRRRLAGRRTLPRSRVHWALDSGGFSELSLYGEWRTTPAEYVTAVHRYDEEIGELGWAAPQDWMCEPFMTGKTGLPVAEHQRRTVDNFAWLCDLWAGVSDADMPFMPVLQGWARDDYLRCWDLYHARGITLADYPLVGLGSVCRRQATAEIGDIVHALRALDPELPLHGFGVKRRGLELYGPELASADSMAWSYQARREPPLDGCTGHINCANCLRYALRWRAEVVDVLDRAHEAPRQLALDLTGRAA